mmetsp:Transcript_13943/g.16200  ORF Transcript_13943/g.16200 Transcript_13943/m.16200 type:complete len:238 (-) Transcript_13943:191-904(-)|eukprot:CAMPEP_0204845162 /NCGR_PEP_ID=MMETSP1347-20130617/934_1 /ASSEMBLY_ACC=CAM_ASM_000690 /TAXON_ID=215587 /ORGANISM="Aplanochytrium stocchinoi, Strain GSBS06" /LENGTH=237 /DNA_ID=CAMNT_0051985073 /DNA_START=45 /DNA_END=758 /DNA_ORIENTATION=+
MNLKFFQRTYERNTTTTRTGAHDNSKALESDNHIEVLGEIKKKIHLLEQRQEFLAKQSNTLKAAAITAGQNKDISKAKQKLNEKNIKDKESRALDGMILQLHSQVSEITIASTTNETLAAMRAGTKLMKKIQVDVDTLEDVLEGMENLKEVNKEIQKVFESYADTDDINDVDEELTRLLDDDNDATGSSEAILNNDNDEIKKLIDSIDDVRPPTNSIQVISDEDEIEREIQQLQLMS